MKTRMSKNDLNKKLLKDIYHLKQNHRQCALRFRCLDKLDSMPMVQNAPAC